MHQALWLPRERARERYTVAEQQRAATQEELLLLVQRDLQRLDLLYAISPAVSLPPRKKKLTFRFSCFLIETRRSARV